MPRFSQASEAQLVTCHPKLQQVLREAIKHHDFTVVEGHRGREAQEAAVRAGNSQLHWPHGNHNASPSRAADVTPYPVSWAEDGAQVERLDFLGGFICGIAAGMGVKLRWGGDWDGDLNIAEERFRDRYHIELGADEV